MPGLGGTEPFLDPDQLELCRQLSENYDVITEEYEALLQERFDRKGKDRFQSVTSMVRVFLHGDGGISYSFFIMKKSFTHDVSAHAPMKNYDSGWKTMVLFYNGHR